MDLTRPSPGPYIMGSTISYPPGTKLCFLLLMLGFLGDPILLRNVNLSNPPSICWQRAIQN
ncbi:hypothetical protein Csa_002984 [Cucumis sativus]|nr:hypothetical protein Csa_002984 [Cucumis sativus]